MTVPPAMLAASSIELPGDPLGFGPGPHELCMLDWRALSGEEHERFVLDHLGDDFLAAEPEAFWRDTASGKTEWLGRTAWLRPSLEPLALVGRPGMRELGASWREAMAVAAVLFLDHAATPPAVVGWDGSPVRGLVPIAASLDELALG